MAFEINPKQLALFLNELRGRVRAQQTATRSQHVHVKKIVLDVLNAHHIHAYPARAAYRNEMMERATQEIGEN